MEWLDNNKIKITPPRSPKKITGTRFATILGLNKWSTPFEAWCEITRVYQEPFVDSIYTLAGKAIEPLQIEYMKNAYFMEDIRTPEDVYGEDYFKATWGDFFKEDKIFGGMWDALIYKNGKLDTVLECKTTKRAEDWLEDIPEYYALQVALYAYLLNTDKVIMQVSFLEQGDYGNPSNFKPNANNTMITEFRLSERYPNFNQTIEQATEWWNRHIVGGISPEYDEVKDAKILSELRNNCLTPNTDISLLLIEAENIKKQLDEVKPLENRLKIVNNQIKEYAQSQFREGDKSVSLQGKDYLWRVSKSERVDIDREKLEQDGLLNQYSKLVESFRITNSKLKEED